MSTLWLRKQLPRGYTLLGLSGPGERNRDSAVCFYSRLQRGPPSAPGRAGDELCILDTDPVCQSSTALMAVRPKGLGFPGGTHLRQALSARGRLVKLFSHRKIPVHPGQLQEHMAKHTYMWKLHICEGKKKSVFSCHYPHLPALFGHEEMQTGQSVHFLPGPWPV